MSGSTNVFISRSLHATSVDRRGSARGQAGFTLVELLMVIAVIGILATLVIPGYAEYVNRSRNTRAKADIGTLTQDINAYYIDKGYFPSSLSDVGRSQFRDPWGESYVYVKLQDSGETPLKDPMGEQLNTDFDLYSKGPDQNSQIEYDDTTCKDDVTLLNNGTSVGSRGGLF